MQAFLLFSIFEILVWYRVRPLHLDCCENLKMCHHFIYETHGDDFYHHHHKLWRQEMERVGFKGKITRFYGRFKTKEGE